MSAHTHTRNPHGVADTKPIALRLLPEERDQAERLARKTGCSMSWLAREAYLKGLPLINEAPCIVLQSEKPV
jgi:hypothetical protein